MKKTTVSLSLTFALSGLLTVPATAGELTVTVEVPQLSVAEYHRPYVAVWLEGADQKVAANLSVWYQQRDTNEGHGTKWLPDLRQWWRKSGRTLKLPVDGVSGPTKPVGKHALKFTDAQPQLAQLAPGEYTLVVEAAREVGGRELVKVPFTWPAKSVQNASAKGSTELGAVSVSVKP